MIQAGCGHFEAFLSLATFLECSSFLMPLFSIRTSTQISLKVFLL